MAYIQSGESVFSPSANSWIDVAFLSHAYTYNTDGTVATDTISDGKNTWVKTYTYATNGMVQNETSWVRQ